MKKQIVKYTPHMRANMTFADNYSITTDGVLVKREILKFDAEDETCEQCILHQVSYKECECLPVAERKKEQPAKPAPKKLQTISAVILTLLMAFFGLSTIISVIIILRDFFKEGF